MTLEEFRAPSRVALTDRQEHQIISGVTKGAPPAAVGDYRLIKSNERVAFYDNGTDIIMAVRGTRPSVAEDRAAAFSTLYNGLENTDLYKGDEALLRQVHAEYPERTYKGVGYSLGGAIVDELMDKGLLDSGHSYNPAVQPKNFFKDTKHIRTYNEGDILYNTMGQFVSGNDVRPASYQDSALNTIPIIAALNARQSHSLSSLEPQMDGSGLPNFLCRVGSKKQKHVGSRLKPARHSDVAKLEGGCWGWSCLAPKAVLASARRASVRDTDPVSELPARILTAQNAATTSLRDSLRDVPRGRWQEVYERYMTEKTAEMNDRLALARESNPRTLRLVLHEVEEVKHALDRHASELGLIPVVDPVEYAAPAQVSVDMTGPPGDPMEAAGKPRRKAKHRKLRGKGRFALSSDKFGVTEASSSQRIYPLPISRFAHPEFKGMQFFIPTNEKTMSHAIHESPQFVMSRDKKSAKFKILDPVYTIDLLKDKLFYRLESDDGEVQIRPLYYVGDKAGVHVFSPDLYSEPFYDETDKPSDEYVRLSKERADYEEPEHDFGEPAGQVGRAPRWHGLHRGSDAVDADLELGAYGEGKPKRKRGKTSPGLAKVLRQTKKVLSKLR
jgi:hypothetical protein